MFSETPKMEGAHLTTPMKPLTPSIPPNPVMTPPLFSRYKYGFITPSPIQVCGQAQAWLREEDVPAMQSPMHFG